MQARNALPDVRELLVHWQHKLGEQGQTVAKLISQSHRQLCPSWTKSKFDMLPV